MANETLIADSFLYSTLAGDATITGIVGAYQGRANIHSDVADIEAPYPFIVYSMQSPGQDLIVVGPYRVWAAPLYLVKVVAQARSYGGNLKTVADRIDTLLSFGHGAATGGQVVASVRESPWRQSEFTNSKYYRSLGGLYRLQVQST
jgi:hypothetical protein